VGEWTEVACLEPEGGRFKAELGGILDSFLSERGMRRNEIGDDDIRLDLVYLSLQRGAA